MTRRMSELTPVLLMDVVMRTMVGAHGSVITSTTLISGAERVKHCIAMDTTTNKPTNYYYHHHYLYY